MTKILYYHRTEIKPYMQETADLMKFVKKYHSKEFEIVDCITRVNSQDMGLHLGKNWNIGHDLIICGQDNVPTVAMLYELKKCDERICVNPCISYFPSTDLKRPVLNQIDKYGKVHEAHERPRTAYYGGTGVSKISLKVQEKMPERDFDFGFPRFDHVLKTWGLVNWHCHYPIHRHNKQKIEHRKW